MKNIVKVIVIGISGALVACAQSNNSGMGSNGQGKGRPSLSDVFTKLDADQSGAISYNEFHLPPRRGGQSNDSNTNTESMKKARFDEIDTDGNGALSQSEFTSQTRPTRPSRN